MDYDRENIVARSLSAQDVALLPHIPYLLQDLWELGSDPQVMVTLLSEHCSLNSHSRILDLGCGKGAVSIAVANTFGCFVKGRDLMPAFIEEALGRAEENGVRSICSFSVEDIRESVEYQRNNDVAIYGADGSIFTNTHILFEKLKQTVRPNGYIVIDDVYAPDGYASEDYPTLRDWQNVFGQAGLEIVDAIPTDPGMMRKMNRFNQRAIEDRARQLIGMYPEKEDLFAAYVTDQQAECEMLDSVLVGTTWLLQVL